MLASAESGNGPQVGADRALAVLAGGRLGVDIGRVRTGDSRHWPRLLGKLGAQNLIKVGGRVGGDDQHAFALPGERDRGRAGERGLTHHPTLASEERNTGGTLNQ